MLTACSEQGDKTISKNPLFNLIFLICLQQLFISYFSERTLVDFNKELSLNCGKQYKIRGQIPDSQHLLHVHMIPDRLCGVFLRTLKRDTVKYI